MFSPGDKVSFINDRLNGVIKSVLDKRRVLVILEDGFEIPVDTKELVLRERGTEVPETKGSSVFTVDAANDNRIFLAFTIDAKDMIESWLVNNRNEKLVFTVFVHRNAKYAGIKSGEASELTAIKLAAFPLEEADNFRNWYLRILSFPKSASKLAGIVETERRLRPANLLKAQEIIPLIGVKGLMTDIGMEEKDSEKEPESHTELVAEPEWEIPDVVDLHIPPGMGKESVTLSSQMAYFQNMLEKAIAAGVSPMTFIHGVGNGILKNQIIGSLKRDGRIERWEKADYRKFGYGATVVFLK